MRAEIEVVRDHLPFKPGDLAEGKVKLKTNEEGVHTIKIGIIGEARNFWTRNEDDRATIYDRTPDSNKQSGQYDAYISILGSELAWDRVDFKSEQSIEFPFSFQLPTECLTSFEGSVGRIRYWIRVITLNYRGSFMARREQFEKVFQVKCPQKVPEDRLIDNVFKLNESKNLGIPFFRKGEVKLKLCIPKIVWKPSELIRAAVAIENLSKATITELDTWIEETTEYRAFASGKQRFEISDPYPKKSLNPLHWDLVRDKEKFIEKHRIVKVAPKSEETFDIFLVAHAGLKFSFDCPITRRYHTLKISISSDESLNSKVLLKCPLTILDDDVEMPN